MLALENRLPPTLSRLTPWLRVTVEVVNVILVIALARALASLVVALWFGPSLPTTGIAVSTGPGASAIRADGSVHSPADYAAISAWHLFGRLEVGRPVEASPVALPVTPLNLKLVGVFFVEQGDQALALIAEEGNLERGYRIGAPLPGGALLERIQRDHVIVSRNGRQELLNLPKLNEIDRLSIPAAEPESPPQDDPEVEAIPASFREPRVIDAKTVADRLRGEAAVRPQVLEDIAFASPYVQNGQFVGFRLRPGRDAQLLRQLGLSSGDVITEINGSRLGSPIQGLAMLHAVLNANQVEVRVLRNGAEIPLTFSLAGSPD
jgi:general secretion pathway protein C